ncbi:hypothetical protein WICPIJ_006388 [Wickerhamomyces pijperi]|uniref:SP-RING-type domain-containing protein n=1 Tax=Wickerhamomyces pijperi TaxID=599730 RepID=A0A9P8Q282_WICPI|nr:hypothetical protein WICPIJ_006388 [Wickerhamomyces pijperi]
MLEIQKIRVSKLHHKSSKMSQLPTYVPIDIQSKEFRELSSYLLADDDLKGTCDDIIASAMEYLGGIIEEDFSSRSVREDGELDRLEPVKTLVESYEKLALSRMETLYFNRAFIDGKQEIMDRFQQEPPLTVDTIAHYASISPNTKDLTQLIEEKANSKIISQKSKRKVLESNKDYRYLKNATFIIDNPLEPIPKEGEENDDDLEMAGGTVDLKCPITYKTFENPMISKKCEHIFDQAAIEDLWRRGGAIDCPVPGCGKSLLKSDFEPDRIMSLRVKSWARLQIKLEKQQTYERI